MDYQAHNTEASVFQRVASGGEKTIGKAIDLLKEYNFPIPNNRRDLARALTQLAAENGEEAVKKIALIHPDFDFVVSNASFASALAPSIAGLVYPYHNMLNGKPVWMPTDTYKNDCGCNGHHSDTGAVAGIIKAPAAIASATDTNHQSKMDLYSFASVMVLGLGGLAFFSFVMNYLISGKK